MRLRWPGAPEGERAVIISKTRSPFLTEVAQTLANNKYIARERLGALGLPVVAGELFDESSDPNESPEAAARARALLERWGSVVVKPNWGNRGLGIVTDVDRFELLCEAFASARERDRDEEVLIEPMIDGVNLRVAVIGGEVVATAQVVRPHLRGDGRSSVRALLDRLNADPRRGTWTEPSLLPLDRIDVEDVADRVGVAGLELDDVLADGAELELSFEEIEVVDRTDVLAPAWADVARTAALALGIDVAGVDLRGPLGLFIHGTPADAEGAGLLEVNALPALHLHVLPTMGPPRPVFEAFVRYCLQMPGAPAPCAKVSV
jgi:cyanophycin synthetase